MDLTIGPIAFFWTADTVRSFYRDLTASPARRVHTSHATTGAMNRQWPNVVLVHQMRVIAATSARNSSSSAAAVAASAIR